MSRPERTVVVIGVSVVALVIAAVVVVLAVGTPDPATFPAGSPEDTLQRYLRAVQAGNVDEAYDFLSTRARREVSRDQFSRIVGPGTRLRDTRLQIDRTEVNGDRATIYVTVEHTSGSGLDFNRYSYQQIVVLVREEGAWRIDQPYLGF